MPNFPIVDSHVHFWDPKRLRYSWLDDEKTLNRAYGVEDYREDSGALDIEAMIFLEADTDAETNADLEDSQAIEELRFAMEETERDPRLMGIVPRAPLERGAAVRPLLERMLTLSPLVKGIRRIVQSEADPAALMLSAGFIDGVRMLGSLGLHFEITVNHTQMDVVLDFAKRINDIPLILDHCGKPGIRSGRIDAFRRQIGELARHPNVFCKLSGLTTEADHRSWRKDDMLPYIDAALDAFGPRRLIYGSDWPVCKLATTHERWIATLDEGLAGLPENDLRAIYRDNAVAFYRLSLN